MSARYWAAGLALALAGLCHEAAAQTAPLQLAQPAMLVDTDFQLGLDWQSKRGVPLSSTAGNGSDGRYAFTNGPSLLPNTPYQFQSCVTVASVPVQGSTNLVPSAGFASNVVSLRWPHSTTDGNPNSPVALILRSAQIGAPYFGQQVSFYFGQVIPVPSTDENGLSLPLGSAQNYWFPMPFTTNNYATAPYYWSRNAQAVFATQPGVISITWQKATPTSTAPPDYAGNPANYYIQAGYYYRLYTLRYLVSGTPIQPPQKMYWTEGSFGSLGKPVDVPTARVSAVNVVYNNAFPATAAPYQDPNAVPPTNPTNMFQETRTLWFDSTRNQILAYNVEGRVFVELLGELNPDNVTRRYLGCEIVDVFKQPVPQDVTIDLGEKVTAYQDGRDDSALYPWPVDQVNSAIFFYQQYAANGGNRMTYWAGRETVNLNDFQAHWLIEGVAGLRWPYLFDRYHLVWPNDVTRYSQYVRPLVPTEVEAKLTAVPLPTQNAPFIQYQDPLDQVRGKLTDTFAYYTWLVPAYPAHRGLLRFTSGDAVWFERVFSWLDAGLKTNALFANTIATNLTTWNTNNGTFNFGANNFLAPRVLNATVNVGDRISPPADETWSGTNYWAGYILQTNGNSFDINAYQDPFVVGFTQANLTAIIPVNAIPGHNLLEIWWFRGNQADGSLGFVRNYWPAIIGRYTLQWPVNGDEIILARNDGSGPLDNLQAQGRIYTQNDPTLAGYNPNEEHAIMIGGQAWALRDDLNITNALGYSSAPFVLLEYVKGDGRPAMHAFKVRREKPEAGILFDYVAEAGAGVLQAPMPLPVMEPPVEGIGINVVNYNAEPPGNSLDLPGGWNSGSAQGPYSHYQRFTFEDRKHDFHVYRGLHAGLPLLRAGQYVPASDSFGQLPAALALVGSPYAYYIQASRRQETLTMGITPDLPGGLSLAQTNGLWAILGVPTATGSNLFTIRIQDAGNLSTATNTLSLAVATNGTPSALGLLAITSTNQYSGAMNTFTSRPPHLAQAPTPANSFTMRFYYKTQKGFAWPGLGNPPPEETIVPYLRPWDPIASAYAGDPTNKYTASLDIVYRPVWPAYIPGVSPPTPLPKLFAGQTLTDPINNLAAVRGNSSALVLYQQSIATNLTAATASVALFDPTCEKASDLTNAGLTKLPDSIRTDSYQGRLYFPNLPPHLVQRLFFDPHRGTMGALVFQGQFNSPPTGASFLDLNVLSGDDLAAVLALCTPVRSQL